MFSANPRLRRLSSGAISLALFLVLGGPWALLQSAAWSKMVFDYSRQASIREAFSKTFDGNHPCGLCKKITKAKEGESHSPLVVVQGKKEGTFISVSTAYVSAPDSCQQIFTAADPLAPSPLLARPSVPIPKV